MERENQIFGIRAIIEAIQCRKQKLIKCLLQKELQGDLMQGL